MRRWAARVGQHGAGAGALAIDLLLISLLPALPFPSYLLVAAVVLGHLPALLLPRRTLLGFGSVWLLGVVVALTVPVYGPLAGVCLALYRVTSVTWLGPALLAMLAAAVPFGLNAVNTVHEVGEDRSASTYLLAACVWGLLLLIPWVLGRLTFLNARRVDLREQLRAAEAAGVLQRQRLDLARELHDIVSHSVSAMILQAAGARAGSHDEARMQSALEAVETTGVQAMRELHRLLGLLRSVSESDADDATASAHETMANLEPLLETVRACDVDVEVTVDGEPAPLDPSIDHAAYRVLQECLANVIKHAGRRATARVHVSWQPGELHLSVRSTPGLLAAEARPDLSTGLGLRGLRERVDLIGGRFEAGPAADGAFLASAVLPWARAALPASSVSVA